MKRLQVVIVIALLLAVFAVSVPESVEAAPLRTTTFYTCPSYDKVKAAILGDYMIYFDIPNNCTVYFEDDITISGYAIVSNVGDYDVIFHGNADDADEDDDTNFFSVYNGGSLELNNITMTYGKANMGGAIYVYDAYLTLEDVTFSHNIARERGGALYLTGGDVEIRNTFFKQNGTVSVHDGSTGAGGAIYASNFSDSSRLFILDSTFKSNQTGDSYYESTGRGGALYLYNVSGGMLVNIFNSTFFMNQTGDSTTGDVGDGGAIYANNYGGSLVINLFNSTLSRNGLGYASSGQPGEGASVYLRESTLDMAGSIMANSYSSYGGAGYDCAYTGDAVVEDGGYNIVEEMGECKDFFSASTSKQIDPGLAAGIGAIGDSTPVVVLGGSGYAVDKIPVGMTAFGVNICGYDYAAADQRGQLRPGGDYCDVGAYEIVDDSHPFTLPSTGFPQGVVTELTTPAIEFQSVTDAADGAMVLSIPTLGTSGEIVGVPQNSYGWEVDWLGDDIGYLYGTSYPTWDGNTVLTGHSTNNLGQDGVFADLDQLTYGDTIIITAWGEQYVYSVQKHYQTTANDSSVVASSTENMLTLVTCSGYNARTGEYAYRDVVVAVLVAIR